LPKYLRNATFGASGIMHSKDIIENFASISTQN
jgi:hypothetical protein